MRREEQFPLFPGEETRIMQVAQQVWNDIGNEALMLSPHRRMQRAAVVEVVMDAGRLEDALLRNPGVRASLNLMALVRVWADIKHPLWREADTRMLQLVKRTFPASVYGL